MSCVKKTMDVTPGRGTSISIDAEATCQIRTDDPEITSHVLWPTELRWRTTRTIEGCGKECQESRPRFGAAVPDVRRSDRSWATG